MPYDSSRDTMKHMNRVQDLLGEIRLELGVRGLMHDRSKLVSPEKEVFDRVTPRLKELTYGSEEYKACLEEMGEALAHHYQHNRHHPEAHPNGIEDMTLIDLIEMLVDWKAASERHADGSIVRSIRHNTERFRIDPQLVGILENTAVALGWVEEDSE